MDEMMPQVSQESPDTSLLASISGMPNIIIPQPFDIADPANKPGLDKIRDEVMDKLEQWENKMTTMFGEYEEYTDSWRVIARKKTNSAKSLFNSKSAETHRATETLATLWFKEMTSADPFFYAQSEGLDESGNEVSELALQSVEYTMRKQLQFIRFNEKLMRAVRSLALFGTMIVECPWVSFPYGNGEKVFEGTDMILRPLLTTAFNPFTFDLDQSDFLAPIDFPTVQMLRNWCRSDPKNWNVKEVERIYADHKSANSQGGSKSMTFNRVIQRKQRAGYNVLDTSNLELVNYHGRIDTENEVVQKYWESEGRTDEPGMCDFSTRILQESGVIAFNATPFKTWHHLFKTAHTKLFEMEPLGYGVGKIGRKRQKELDATESRTNDLLMFNVLPMWKIGKYAGVDVSKLTIKPWSFVELENIDQLEPIKANIEAIPFSLNVQNTWKQDMRTAVNATDSLQGERGGGTATLGVIAQNESMRVGSVMTKIVAETFLREFLDSSHINNTFMMDNGFWIKTMNSPKPFYVNKDNLPANVGFIMKLQTDTDNRQEVIKNIISSMQIFSSIRNTFDPQMAMNMEKIMAVKLLRALGEDVRQLSAPIPMVDQMLYNMRNQQNKPQGQNMIASEKGGEQAGGGGAGGNNVINSPVGPVATSPNQQPARMS